MKSIFKKYIQIKSMLLSNWEKTSFPIAMLSINGPLHLKMFLPSQSFSKKITYNREVASQQHVASLIQLHQISFIISVMERSFTQNIIY